MRVVAFDPADSGLIASDQAFARREDTLSVLAKASVLTLSGRATNDKRPTEWWAFFICAFAEMRNSRRWEFDKRVGNAFGHRAMRCAVTRRAPAMDGKAQSLRARQHK